MPDDQDDQRDRLAATSAIGSSGFGSEVRDRVLMKAMVAACAIVSFADERSSLVERWSFVRIVSEDSYLRRMPRGEVAEEWAFQQKAFREDPERARHAALELLSQLPADKYPGNLIEGLCVRLINADGEASDSEVAAFKDVLVAYQSTIK